LNGIEATKQIREEEAKHPESRALILGLTSAVADEDLQKYKAAGMDGCIAKGNLLAEALADAIKQRTANPQVFVVSKLDS